MTELVSERTVRCTSDICSLWAVITDTDRLNRLVGMQRLSLQPLADGTAARYLVKTKLNGFDVEYEERPFEWVYPERFRVLRKMRSGPAVAVDMQFSLKPVLGGGTDVTIRLGVTPRFAVLAPVILLLGGRSLRRFEEAVREVDEDVRTGVAVPKLRSSKAHADALAHAREALVAASPHAALAHRLADHVRDAGDDEIGRIRPFELADTWKLDRREVLGTALAGVRAGLLELRWEVVCPSCRTATDVLPSLASLSDHGTCQLCEIGFAVDLEEAVEATFAPARAVRSVDVGTFCVGGPARTPHVVVQQILPPRGEARLTVPTEPGRYRVFVRGGLSLPLEVVAEAAGEARVRLDGPGLRDKGASGPEALRLAPGGALTVENASSEERHVKIEHVTWARQAATAHFVTTMPGFRRDFSLDILRPGTALKIARVGVFFSDLTGSTKLYADAGDAAAFKLVQDHFDLVIKLLEGHHGTLVKTIGDAVMAVFADDLDGLTASLALLRAFERFRQEHPSRLQTQIKLGVLGGSCYAVTANGVLDYFGQTVNVAARLQGEAQGGELVVAANLADRAIAAGKLDAGAVVERYDARLKGVAAPLPVARIR